MWGGHLFTNILSVVHISFCAHTCTFICLYEDWNFFQVRIYETFLLINVLTAVYILGLQIINFQVMYFIHITNMYHFKYSIHVYIFHFSNMSFLYSKYINFMPLEYLFNLICFEHYSIVLLTTHFNYIYIYC